MSEKIMNKQSIIRLFKKHYLLASLTVVGLLLLGWLGITMGLRPALSTPIASIEPKDSLTTLAVSSKLESYLEELKPKPGYKAAREEVMAMDFSTPYHSKPKINTKYTQAERKDSAGIEPKNSSSTNSKNQAAPEISSSVKRIAVSKKMAAKPIGVLKPGDGFYTLKAKKDSQQTPSASSHRFVRAVIEGDQKLQIGAALRLRLKEDASWKGQAFPKNTILYGTIGSGSNGRLKIHIARVRETSLSLSVFDHDLQEGLVYRMNEPVNEALKESSRDVLNEVFYSLPYGGVAGGIARLGRNLFGKMGTGKKGEVYLADGYEIFIAPIQ